MTNVKYGWKRDRFDSRDHRYSVPAYRNIPDRLDLREHGFPAILNQGDIGSCTAHALSNAHLYSQLHQPGGKGELISRLFLYYKERESDGDVSADNGSSIRTGINVLANIGAPYEADYPYDVTKFADKPDDSLLDKAKAHIVASYERIEQNEVAIKSALSVNERPIPFGIEIFSYFESDSAARNGVMHVPTSDEQYLGGHAVLLVGYDDSTRTYTVANSWGEDWGDKGFFYLPYDYVHSPKLADDFWCIKLVDD